MKRFTRVIEDFNCAHCGAVVRGNGYTNHCPRCLWSRHVDNNPGDRASECRGMMRPIAAQPKGYGFIITHKCEKCGKTIRQKSSPEDDVDALIALTVRNNFILGR